MTRWKFRLRNGIDGPIDASNIRRARLIELSDQEINQIGLEYAGATIPLGELFDCQTLGSDDQNIVVQGNLRKTHGLAAAHDCGEFRIEGGAGDRVGSSMSGGTVVVQGSVGDHVGGPLGNRKSGMSGGNVVVSGDCGANLGHRMRRGTIAIAGDAGNGTAVAMIAGTICIGGKASANLGVGMRRGTILLSHRSPELMETGTPGDRSRFSGPIPFDPSFLALYSDPTARLVTEHLQTTDVLRVRADRTIEGIGEVLFPR